MDAHTHTNATDWFEQWFGSPYYKILYQNHDEQEAQQFVENILRLLSPPQGAQMLDIACGEGRLSVQLAEHDFDVTGIDLSQPSIEAAMLYETANLHFHVQDMRFAFNINYFDYAFNFFTSFGYFKYDRDNRLAARAFAQSLKKGGTLVIDYMNSNYVVNNFISESTIERGEYTFLIKKRIERNHIIKDIYFADSDNKQRHYCESVTTFMLNDFITLFKNAGLTLIDTFGNYKLEPFNVKVSPRLIMIFKKD